MPYGISAPASSTIILFIVLVWKQKCRQLFTFKSFQCDYILNGMVDWRIWGLSSLKICYSFVVHSLSLGICSQESVQIFDSEPGSFRIWTFKVKWRLWALVSAAMCCRNNFFDRHITLCPCVLEINLLNELLPAQWPRLISWTAPGSLCFAIFCVVFFHFNIWWFIECKSISARQVLWAEK